MNTDEGPWLDNYLALIKHISMVKSYSYINQSCESYIQVLRNIWHEDCHIAKSGHPENNFTWFKFKGLKGFPQIHPWVESNTKNYTS